MPLAERMILAMEAGQNKGGDRRFGNLQSAAIKVADPNDPGRGGDHITLAIEVGEHPEPVGEMKRIYYTTGRRLGYRTFSKVEGQDMIELKRMLHALGYWRSVVGRLSRSRRRTRIPRRCRSCARRIPRLMRRRSLKRSRRRLRTTASTRPSTMEPIAAVDKFRADKSAELPGQPAWPGRSAIRRRAQSRVS